ncbi:LOW QUALITY PROTEIN: N-acetylgalactosaminyltransferase 4-like [Drosophila busckii]|uniref:LOW QUALITY PROTEIN: N-acetylgalactosaminyltransferase 4-like n=1 Tax=Drosophila busckii TaxID=30019 RepID=UPI001432ECE4|nr:LOW QUALITY PROTEIN: N-acetylgalactosaminyltransferase 4-like [Drosophila busckii]
MKRIGSIEINVHLKDTETKRFNNENKSKQFTLPIPNGELKDWADKEAIQTDRERFGPGENGKRVIIKNQAEKDLEKRLYRFNGFNALVSEKISVNRSVPDARSEKCKQRKYLAKLPSVSVILIFYEEHFHTLLRSIHSIINRTPKELLHQIVLVDDYSSKESLKAPLDGYISEHFPPIIKIVRNQKRLGLIGARLAGAKSSTGEVLVFFDSHIEVNYNWLPPLLEPITINSKICTCPLVDGVAHNDFKYRIHRNGARGGLNWRFSYKQLPLFPEDKIQSNRCHIEDPVMMGGLFAISKAFFWDLGGYDDGLDIWGAEQFELSFKIWMCGGMILDVPCSHVAHIFRGPMDERPSPRDFNFLTRNQKRVAEVWMDEYKQYMYMRDPEYAETDAGNLTRMLAVRERLKCKSFDWYMKTVAYDFLIKYPPIDPPSYANGAIQSLKYMQYCLDTMGEREGNRVELYPCAKSLIWPHDNQNWVLSADRVLAARHENLCLNIGKHTNERDMPVWMWKCVNGTYNNQFFYYDRKHNWLVHGQHTHLCLEVIRENGKPQVVANECISSRRRQRWKFGTVNNTMLDNFFHNMPTNKNNKNISPRYYDYDSAN